MDPDRREVSTSKGTVEPVTEYVCHLHDGNNSSVGKGRGPDPATAMKRAVNSAKEGTGKAVKKGSFGCAETSEEAHEKALKANSAMAHGLPGLGITDG